MDKIRENIYIGSSQDALHRPDQLRANEITAVLNVARDLLNPNLNPHEFKLYHVGIMDGGGNNEHFCGAATDVLHGLLEDGEVVLVHCHEGKSRSAAVIANYLTYYLKEFETFSAAEKYLQSIRPRVEIHPELKLSFDFTNG